VRMAFFPLGVELMNVSFRHTFDGSSGTSEGQNPPHSLRGDSSLKEQQGDVHPLDTEFPNNRHFPSGAPVVISVGEMLAMAGLSLDTYNTGEQQDARSDRTNHPMTRLTGARLNVKMKYSNRNPDSGRPDVSITQVRAKAEVRPQTGWAGMGALPTIFVQIPYNHTYHTIDRYRQGIVINFQGTGIFYWFDFVTAFFAVVLGAVVLSAAGTITDFIAINLMRCKRKPGGGYTLALTATSQVLRAKRVEQVSPDFVMAAQSMVGALAVSSFRALDTDGDGLIDAENMVSAFARVNGITYAEAVEMTKLIMHKGDRGGGKSDGTLSFTEFVSVIAQDMMPFDKLLEYMGERQRLGMSRDMEINLNGLDEERFYELRKTEQGPTLAARLEKAEQALASGGALKLNEPKVALEVVDDGGRAASAHAATALPVSVVQPDEEGVLGKIGSFLTLGMTSNARERSQATRT